MDINYNMYIVAILTLIVTAIGVFRKDIERHPKMFIVGILTLIIVIAIGVFREDSEIIEAPPYEPKKINIYGKWKWSKNNDECTYNFKNDKILETNCMENGSEILYSGQYEIENGKNIIITR